MINTETTSDAGVPLLPLPPAPTDDPAFPTTTVNRMMIMDISPRTVPYELQILHALNARSVFQKELETHYTILNKGFKGEKMFDDSLAQLTCDALVLRNLQLEISSSFVQIDTLLLTPETLHLFEVKNYEGDYEVRGDKWFTPAGKEMKSPVLQLSRSETLLNQFLSQTGFAHIPISGRIVLPNPSFHLFNSRRDMPLLFSSQINRFIGKLNESTLRLSSRHYSLYDHFHSMSLDRSPYERLPEYRYEELKKGLVCPSCRSLGMGRVGRKIKCTNCNYLESPELSILRSVADLLLLFPERKLTVSGVKDWSGERLSSKTIRSVLEKHYVKEGNGTGIHFTTNSE